MPFTLLYMYSSFFKYFCPPLEFTVLLKLEVYRVLEIKQSIYILV